MQTIHGGRPRLRGQSVLGVVGWRGPYTLNDGDVVTIREGLHVEHKFTVAGTTIEVVYQGDLHNATITRVTMPV
jgi:hypothetical protein